MLQCNIKLEDVEKNDAKNLYFNEILLNLKVTPQVGLEPTTIRLTAERSTTELLKKINIISLNYSNNFFKKCQTWKSRK